MVRYGIVGFGLHAVRRLMPGFERAEQSAAIAMSRRDQAKASDAAVRYAIPHVFPSTEELCRCAEVDAVFVTSPNALHLPDVMTAVRHGKPVLCEKPMAMNVAEAEEMLAAADSAGVLLGIAQCFRFTESVNRIRNRVLRGDIGRIISARTDFAFLASGSPRTWIRGSTLSGGGPIADVGVHCIDTLRYILNDEPLRVSAFTESDAEAGAVESSAVINLSFGGGVLGSVFVSFSAPYRTLVEIVGTTGTFFAKDGLTVDRPVTIELFRDGVVAEREEVNNDRAYAHQIDAFSEAVAGKKKYPVPGEEGVKNQRILDAAYRSARSGIAEELGERV